MLNDVGTYVANESTEELNNNNNAPHQHGIDEKKREANDKVEFGGDDAIEDAGFISNTSHEFEAVQYRWVVLILFVLYSSSNAFQWTQLVIISNVIESYYNVSTVTVSWTSIIFMVTYIPLIFPASWFLYHKSLKSTIVIGACGTCLGSWIKLLSFYTSNPFVVVFIGQTVVAISQVFVLGLPAVLAAKWFPTHQVSTACAIGVFGNQLGVALGFVVPPFLVSLKDHDTGETLSEDEVGRDLYVMYLSVSIFTSLTLLGILIGFKSQPMHPPSFQQSQVRRSATARTALTEIHEDEDYPIQQSSFSDSIIQFGRDKNFITLLISYGLNVGVFYAISTILNPVVLIHFKDGQQDVGLIGLLMVVAGMFGSMLCGFILDRTHAYKTTTLVVYIFSFLGMIAFLFSLQSPQIHFVYIAAISLGFFMTGYLPLGFEFAAEITYPESEGTSSGLLNASAQFFGILCTLISEQVLHTFHDDRICNLFLVIILFVGSILTWSIKPDYRRNLAATRAQ